MKGSRLILLFLTSVVWGWILITVQPGSDRIARDALMLFAGVAASMVTGFYIGRDHGRAEQEQGH